MESLMLGWPPNVGFGVQDNEPASPPATIRATAPDRPALRFVRLRPPPGIRVAEPLDRRPPLPGA